METSGRRKISNGMMDSPTYPLRMSDHGILFLHSHFHDLVVIAATFW